MRGSPLIRFILLAIALTATAAGLIRVTATRAVSDTPNPGGTDKIPTARLETVPFRLLLSAPASAVEIDTGNTTRPLVDGASLSGSLKLDLANPQLGLVVRWENPPMPAEHRFAKLTLEIPGQETFNHVFDAQGDIDDFIELPLPTEP